LSGVGLSDKEERKKMPEAKKSKKGKGWEVAEDGGPVVVWKRLDVEIPRGLYALLEKDLDGGWYSSMDDLVHSILLEHYHREEAIAQGRLRVVKLEEMA
jgi:hypothetical protein